MASDIDYSDASSDADSDFEVARHDGKVIPYQFEPERDSSDESSASSETEEDRRHRLESLSW